MLSFTHTITSLPFAILMDNPWLIFVNTFLFHALADTLLHWNIYPWKFKRYPVLLVGLDITGGLAIAWYLMGQQIFSWPVLAAIAGGNAADVIHGLWELTPPSKQRKLFPSMHPFFVWHDGLQLETHHVVQGLLWQIVLIAISLVFIS